MSSFGTRMEMADLWEHTVAAALQGFGWEVEPYGQQGFRRELRDLIHDEPALDRWRPDLIVRRDGRVRLVDPKTCTERNRGSANYAIEKASLSALMAHYRMTGWRVLLVFHDWRVADVEFIWDMVEHEQLRPIPYIGYGSGTPGWLLPKNTTCLLDFEAIFG
jgi:hypothetical protein